MEHQKQSFYQLACIQSASLGIPGILIGQHLSQQYGIAAAICSILAGNLILWLIGIGIVSMVSQSRINAIQNIKGYIGNYGGMAVALILMFVLIGWFVLIIDSSVSLLKSYIPSDSFLFKEINIRLGAALGFLSALLAIGGIDLLKRITVIALPMFFVFHLYSMAYATSVDFEFGQIGFSFPAVLSSVLLLLQGYVNLPTFFRHSRSKADSYLALTLMAFFISFFQISTIWINFDQTSHSNFVITISSLYILLTLICTNLVNIYIASACWETFIPHFHDTKGHAIIGLLGTAAYVFIQISSPIKFFEDLGNYYISNLGIVLLLSFLVRIIVKHRPRTFEKTINGASWLIGCIATTILHIKSPGQPSENLLIGIMITSLFFLTIVFFEESLWSMKKVKERFL